jgi:CRP/FNR family transcriptional regulator, cyclic AMP receptor protein
VTEPRGIGELPGEVPAMAGLAPEHLELIAGCGAIRSFDQGERLFKEGEPADAFYVLRHGRVALEIFVPGRGEVSVATIGPGEIAGWSWLIPPYEWHLDARALERGSAVEFDGACLRGKFDADPALGYELMKRFATVLLERLQATRVQMLDVYGHAHV